MNNIYIPCMDCADPMDVGFLMGKSSYMGKKGQAKYCNEQPSSQAFRHLQHRVAAIAKCIRGTHAGVILFMLAQRQPKFHLITP